MSGFRDESTLFNLVIEFDLVIDLTAGIFLSFLSVRYAA
jgi:hypothetical protein